MYKHYRKILVRCKGNALKQVVAYAAGIPNPHKGGHKLEILKRFVDGVKAKGDVGILHNGNNVVKCDVGVIQGWVHEGSPNTPHLRLRKQAAEAGNCIIVDSNLFNYNVGKLHPMQYLRYSLNGVFPTTGNYFDTEVNPARWRKISKDLNIHLKDWRQTGDHILICTQRNGGWSMQGLDVVQWVKGTIPELRKYTDRPIVVRGHPGDKHARNYLRNHGWKISNKERLTDDLQNAWATITFNSSPGVASAIEGVPIFVTDPNPKISQAFPVCNTQLKDIENPKTYERQEWVEKLSMSHYNFFELSNGIAWEHIRKYV